MNAKVISVVVLVAGLAGAFGLYQVMPERVSQSDLQKALAAETKIDRIETKREETKLPAASAASSTPAPAAPASEASGGRETKGVVANVFKVKFECSNGTFVVECNRDWAPLGAERFEALVKEGFFTEARFFRMITEPQPFVVQFGLAADPQANAKWRAAPLKDDPVKQSNTKGTITFAAAGPNSRTTQVFVNLTDNARLDGMGFAVFGKVIEGMDVVSSFEDKYQGAPSDMQGQIMAQGNAFLDKQFPGLDYIKSATVVP